MTTSERTAGKPLTSFLTGAMSCLRSVGGLHFTQARERMAAVAWHNLRTFGPAPFTAAIFVVVVTMSGCSTVRDTERLNQSAGSIRIRWLPDCGPGTEHPFFSVDVHDDGRVRYEGYEGTKVTGIRESRIDGVDARRLSAKTLSLVQEREAPKDSEKKFEHGYFCLEAFLIRGDETVAAYSRRNDARSSRVLLREVRKTVGPEKWACPASLISEARLSATGYCSERLAFTLRLGGRTACDVSQDLIVYEDGTVYSLTYRTRGLSDRKERSYEISPSAVADLVESIHPFERAVTAGIEDGPPARTQKIYYRYKPADVQSIKNRLAALAPIEWLNTSDATDCERYQGPSSIIQLREDLYPGR